MKEKAERIIEQINTYYSSETINNKLKSELKYAGSDNVKLYFKAEYRQPKTGNPYFSLFVLGKVLYQIIIKKDKLTFKLLEKWFPNIEKNKRTVVIDDFEDIEPLLLKFVSDGLLMEIMQNAANYSDVFECCSRYKECSDSKACVQPIFDVAICCDYWQKIQKGIIGFGKNRNVQHILY